jgi:hypothetical protein
MRIKGNSSVRELLGGKFSTNPPRGYSDQLIMERVEREEGEIKQKVPFQLSKEEKISMYQDIKDRVINGATPDDIAQAVLLSIQEYLTEKQAEAYGEVNSKLKGGRGKFRRVE